MHKKMLGNLTGLLIPFAAYGAHTTYGHYQRRQSMQVAGYQPLSLTDQHTPAVKRSPVSRNDELDLIAADNELSIAAGAPARELIIIDAAVPDKAVLQSAARPGVDIVVLKAGEDALEQTAALLEDYQNLDAVHLVSHGEAGAILLGGQRLDKTALEADPHFLQALGRATRVGADLLLYGCDLASEDAGLLEVIQNNSHLDVAASNNLTGAAELDGDWTLEIAAGNIETDLAFSDKALKDFSAVLRPFGTRIFEGLNTEYYEDDPLIDWDDFTTYIPTPGTNMEILSSGINNSCDDGPGDGLYVSMFDPGSRFYIRSNPAGEYFGVTGLNIRTGSPQYGANTVTITGYDASDTIVGTKGPVTLGPDSPTGTPIDLTTGITGVFADIVRFRIAATSDVAPNDERDFCLVSVDFTSLDSDGDLTPAGGVTEPVGLDTSVDTAAEAVDIFDFTLSDGGGSDDQALSISQLVVNVTGTATDTERAQITWRLNGPDAGNVTGTYNATTDTITFSGLSVSVADGASETYTISAFYNDTTNLIGGHTIELSMDGDTDLTVLTEGTRMGATTPVTNGTGTTIDAVATQLIFTTQPAGSISGDPLVTQPVVEARDAFGNIDVGFTETITLTEASDGSLSGNTQAATGGVATFTNLAYTATADGESFTLTANSGGLMVGANPVTSDVVATGLLFTEQPAPTSIPNGLSTSFTTVPVVSAVDANNAVDTDYSTDITLAEVNGAGTANMTATGDSDGDSTTVTIVPSGGESTFTGMNITYMSGSGSETFNLRASSGALATADSVQLTAIDNQASPTDIALSSNDVNQSAGVNAAVGTLSTTDSDIGDSHSYSLVAGTGDTDNGSFNINGDQLRANDAGGLAAGSYSVRIQTQDSGGETYEEAFTITVVDDELDTDGDGVTDVQEAIDGTDPNDPESYSDNTPPVITAPTDLLIDATGLHTPVTVRQLLDLPASATEAEKQSALDALASDDIDGADCCGTNAATITSNGGTAQAINGDLLWLAPGAHVITWQGEDRKENVGIGTQAVQVQPLVSLSKDQVGVEGGSVSLKVYLNGLSDTYPLNVPYTIDVVNSTSDAADHDLADGNFTFTAGQVQQSVTVNLVDSDGTEGDETLVVDLDTAAVNAGAKTRHTITIREDNIAPSVDLTMQQNTVDTALVVTGDGNVTVTANVSDPNAADTHAYDWSGTSVELTDNDVADEIFVFDPGLLAPGVYKLQVSVTDDPGASDVAELNFRIAASAPALTTLDSDGDGIPDQTEGFGDTDRDGIPDYLDTIAASNVLPVSTAHTEAYLIECDPGVRCRLGSDALGSGDAGAGVPPGDLPEDEGFSKVGGLFDFEAHDLPVPGQTVRVVIPLTQAIPADAVYRKFDGQQWFSFVEDADDALHSSAGAAGFCPPPGDARWEPGLVQGHYCVQLTLEDGGPNDSDGLANGSVQDPGGVAAPVASDGGPGGSDGPDDSDDEAPTAWSINGESKGGGALGLPLLLPLLLIALLRKQLRRHGHKARLWVLVAVLLAPWSQSQAEENGGFAEALAEKGYFSLGLYQAMGDQTQGDFVSAMQADGVNVSVSDYDVRRFAYQLSLGYRYHSKMAIELGYLDLGEVDYIFDAEAANAATLVDALEDHLPITAGGWTLANRFDHSFGQWRTSAHIGLYFWDGKPVISDPAINPVAQDGIDPLIGLEAAYPLFEQLEAGLQYRRVFLDDQDVGLWGLHLSWHF